MIEEELDNLNSQRIDLEDRYFKLKDTIDSKIGRDWSENDIIIEAKLNNELWEIEQKLNKIYDKLYD